MITSLTHYVKKYALNFCTLQHFSRKAFEQRFLLRSLQIHALCFYTWLSLFFISGILFFYWVLLNTYTPHAYILHVCLPAFACLFVTGTPRLTYWKQTVVYSTYFFFRNFILKSPKQDSTYWGHFCEKVWNSSGQPCMQGAIWQYNETATFSSVFAWYVGI